MNTTLTETRDNLPAPVPGSIRDQLSLEKVKLRFREVLADRAPQFLASLATLVYHTPALAECDPATVINAALTAASINLSLDRSLGHATIVPYNSGRSRMKIAQFQMQWKGYIQLAHRSKQYKALNVTEVCEGEIAEINRFTGAIAFGKPKSNKVTGYLAYMLLLNGFEKYLYMTLEEIHAHGRKYSRSYSDPKSKWQTQFDDMARKTVVKQLLTKWGVFSTDLEQAIRSEAIEDEVDDEPRPASTAGQRARDKAALFGDDEPEGTGASTEAIVEPWSEALAESQAEAVATSTTPPGPPATNRKPANIATKGWFTAIAPVAAEFPEYRATDGKADSLKLQRVAAAEGYATITDQNLQLVIEAIRGRIQLDAQDAREPVP